MDRDYAQAYETLFHHHWWFRARSKILVRELERGQWAGRGGAALDVGCGNGLHFSLLRQQGLDPEGVEPDVSVLTPSGRRQGLIHTVPFDGDFRPARCYDLILMLDVLEHLAEPETALAKAAGLLSRGGRILVSVPAFNALWTSHDVRNHHRARYRGRDLRREARSAGLEVRRCAYHFGWLVPIKLAIRAVETLVGPTSALHRVPPEPLNRLFYGLSCLEQLVWRRGTPIGSSLFAELAPFEAAPTSPAGAARAPRPDWDPGHRT